MIEFDPAGYPEWVTGFRETQVTAANEILEAFNTGADVVMLDAPTGTGKTLLAEMVRRELAAQRSVYCCNTIGLQEQFLRDFPEARMLKGRSNYKPLAPPIPFYTCGDCVGSACKWCLNWEGKQTCPYVMARDRAIMSELVVTNSSYLLHEANFVGKFTGLDFVIADESDTLESIMSGFIEFDVPEQWWDRLEVEAPKKGSHASTIRRWVKTDLLPAVEAWESGESDDVKHNREMSGRANLLNGIAGFLKTDPALWVRDNEAGELVFRPISVAPWGNDVLWKHSKRWLCMSGSIISSREQVRSLGAKDLDVRTVIVPMAFKKENRPIYVAPIADMSHKMLNDPEHADKNTLNTMVAGIEAVLDKPEYEGHRVLIHCVSYRLAGLLHDLVDVGPWRNKYTYRNTAERDEAFFQYSHESNAGAVLFAPSMDRGFDFKDDLARVVIIAKVPFPNLGDRQVSARLNGPGGGEWFAVQTARTVLQMTGRGVRNENDWCHTWILDAQFESNLYGNNSGLFPRWWRDGMVRGYRWRSLLEGKSVIPNK